mmetsp:Transcript_14347/g.16407  ORF Transcript_14347/g.16407 Transcript_14347/m.16407 type:complete len:80 (+) Transcript_14347:1291-1530(+)
MPKSSDQLTKTGIKSFLVFMIHSNIPRAIKNSLLRRTSNHTHAILCALCKSVRTANSNRSNLKQNEHLQRQKQRCIGEI